MRGKLCGYSTHDVRKVGRKKSMIIKMFSRLGDEKHEQKTRQH